MKHVELARKTKSSSHWTRLAAASLLAVAALAGCGGGSDGAPGAAGPVGPTGPTGPSPTATVNLATVSATDWAAMTPVATVSSVVINSPPVVTFSVVDGYARPVVGLTTSQLRFTIAKLVPAVNGSPSKWVSYMVGNPDTGAPSRPGTDSVSANLVDNKDGTYQYTFSRDITGPLQTKMAAWFADAANATSAYKKADVMGVDGKLLDYDKNLTHRVAIQLSGSLVADQATLANPNNAIYDFIPATNAVVTAADAQREIAATAKCNECHDKIGVSTPHGGRVDTRYCVACHTDQRKNGRTPSTSTAGVFTGSTYVADGQVSGNFTTMVHKVHMGSKLNKTGYNYAGVLFNDVHYPQEVSNCIKCHDGSSTSTAKTAQGDNWKTAPSVLACGSCHDSVNFTTGVGHIGGAAADDSTCALCHKPGYVDTTLVHAGINKSPNNPVTPAGLVNFTYEISSATVNSTNDLAIKFRILADGAAVTLAEPASVVAASLTGFTGGPSFMLAYGGKDGTGVDFDNAGRAAAQPAVVTIATLLDTDNAAIGNISARESDGSYTATIKSASAFPLDAKLRTVAMQAYYTQAAGTGGIAANTARHTLSVVKTVTGDAKRRVVVEAAKCANCHEVFEGHGGNRNIGALSGSTEVVVCAMCHNPNLSSSGKTLALANPEATNNLKDMVHAIHAGAFREENGGADFEFVRNFNNSARPYNFSSVKFPGILNNCESCHKAGTYASVPTGALLTTDWTTDGTNLTLASVVTARSGTSLPNATDKVITPFTGACFSCHNGPSAEAHILRELGKPSTEPVFWTRQDAASAESCVTCHGVGRISDVTVKHK